MKKVKFKPLYCLYALIAGVVLSCAILLTACNLSTASTSYGGDYSYEFGSYDVTYDISSDCSISVTEVIKVNYTGYDSTGFYRDIPVNRGARVKNVKVEGVELIAGGTHVPYEVIIEDNNFITIDIGSTRNKHNRSETYRITYDYCISNSYVNGNVLSINPIGTGNDCEVLSASVKLILPDGYLSAKRYVGKSGESNEDQEFTVSTENGRTVLTTSQENLYNFEGITFDITFKSGSIHAYFEFTPYWFIIAAGILLILMALVKVLFFNKDMLTPIVNFEAPDGMDPLIMGKLIDNKVNAEDVTALIFYWADKGYLKINLDNKDNPTIIRIMNLPATAQTYEQIVFAGLFKNGDAVKTNDLRYVFYPTFEKATAIVNEKAKGLFKSSSIGVSILFALLGAVLMGLAPLVLGLTAIHSSLTYFYGFIAIIPALVLYGVTETVMYNKLKNKPAKSALYFGALAFAAVICSLIYMVFVPSSIIPMLPKFLLCVLSFAVVMSSVILISRTTDYNQKLNHIVGFRNFIIHAEKDRLEALLESDPQYYYHILPYAQVLNVSDMWEEKFKDITVQPPAWATSSSFDTIVNFTIVNSLIRHSTSSISTGMISRPSSSGLNGGGGHFGGGHFGGHSGGGFGGGGSRGGGGGRKF